jgi:hypothetical protein
MLNKNEKEKRKQMLRDLSQKAEANFESSLPMSRDNFQKLFDYLDEAFQDKECDDTNDLTKHFLTQTGIANPDKVLTWLAEKGGHCDCEILANVEEQFE